MCDFHKYHTHQHMTTGKPHDETDLNRRASKRKHDAMANASYDDLLEDDLHREAVRKSRRDESELIHLEHMVPEPLPGSLLPESLKIRFPAWNVHNSASSSSNAR